MSLYPYNIRRILDPFLTNRFGERLNSIDFIATGGATSVDIQIPADVVAAGSGATANITISWTDNSTGEDGFEVQRSDDGSTGWSTLSDEIAADATSYADTPGVEETAYYYRVRALSSSEGDSDWSEVVNGMVLADPSGAAISDSTSSQVDLTWTDGSSAGDEAVIEVSVNGGDYSELTTVALSTNSYSDTSVSEGTSYDYRVFARRDNGSGADVSDYATFANVVTDLIDPSDVSVTANEPIAGESIEIEITWTDNSSAETGYEVERSTDDFSYSNITTTSAGETTYTDGDSLSEVTLYYYRVRAVNSSNSATSDYAASASDTTALLAPTNLSLSVNDGPSGSIDLTWTSNSTGADHESVERDSSEITTVSTGTGSYSDMAATEGVTYTYRVRAVHIGSGTNSEYTSEESDFIPLSPPSDLSAAASSDSQIDLTWTENSDNDEAVEVERSDDGVSGWTNISTESADAASYSDTGLTSATTYYYRVRVTNTSLGLQSNYSDVASDTTF